MPFNPKRQYVAEEWNNFSRLLLKDAPLEVKRAMKRAFYAGAQSVLFKIINALAPESEPTMDDLVLMDNVHKELSDFAERVKRGEE